MKIYSFLSSPSSDNLYCFAHKVALAGSLSISRMSLIKSIKTFPPKKSPKIKMYLFPYVDKNLISSLADYQQAIK